jgi:hypothetical protein
MAKSAKYVDIRPSPDAKATTPLRSLKFNAKNRNGQVGTGDLVFYALATGSFRAQNFVRRTSFKWSLDARFWLILLNKSLSNIYHRRLAVDLLPAKIPLVQNVRHSLEIRIYKNP